MRKATGTTPHTAPEKVRQTLNLKSSTSPSDTM